MRTTLRLDSVNIYYKTLNSDAKDTVFFLHGIGGSMELLHGQRPAISAANYRSILFDLPNHGESSPLPPSVCNLPSIGKIVAGAIRALNARGGYIPVGSSIGTNLVAEMLYEGMDPLEGRYVR